MTGRACTVPAFSCALAAAAAAAAGSVCGGGGGVGVIALSAAH